MKKNLVAMVILSGVLMASAVTGCGNKAAAPAAAPASAEAGTDATKSTDYLAWSGKEWKAASDEDKAAATKYYMIETVKATAKASGQEYTAEMEASITDEVVTANITILDTAFAADESMTLQDILELTTSAASAMVESALQQTE